MINNETTEHQNSTNKIKKMAKLQRLKKRFKITALVCLLLDTIAFFIFTLLKYLYKIHTDNEGYDIFIFVMSLCIQITVSIVLGVLTYKETRLILLISMLFYVILGTVYALIVIFNHLVKQTEKDKFLPIDTLVDYYTKYIYVYVIVFNSVSWICKVVGSISIYMFYFYNENFEHEFEINNNPDYVLYNRKVDILTQNKYNNESLLNLNKKKKILHNHISKL